VKIPVGVSNRHCHLTEETHIKLFGTNHIEKVKDLSQPGEFASTSKVTIKNGNREIANVRVLGPFRNYNQVEISKTDAYKLRVEPPVRKSGDIIGSEVITLIGPCGEIVLEDGCIIANRHVHFQVEEAKRYNIKEDQIIMVKINGEKKGSIEAFAKILEQSYLELHIDIDDANAFLLTNGDEVEIVI